MDGLNIAEGVLSILDNIEEIENGTTTAIDLGFPDLKITYCFYDTLVDGLLAKGHNLQTILPTILKSINDKCILPDKISNFTRKVRKTLQKKPGCGDTEIVGLFSQNIELDETLKNAGVTLERLVTESLEHRTDPVPLTNNAIINLRRILKQKSLPWKMAVSWICNLMCQTSKPNEHSITTQWNALHSKFLKLTTSGKKNDLAEFLQSPYALPDTENKKKGQNSTGDDTNMENIRAVHVLRQALTDAYDELFLCSNILRDIAEENCDLKDKNVRFEASKEQFDKKTKEVKDLKKQFAAMANKNVKRRIKRKDDEINKLKNKLAEKDEQVEQSVLEAQSVQSEMEKLQADLEKLRQEKLKEQKTKHYWKKKAQTEGSSEKDKYEEIIKNMAKEIKFLECAVDDDLAKSDEPRKLKLFENGKYIDAIRMVYMDLLNSGVSVEHCQSAVRSVLKLVNVDVDRLPQKSLASIISVEALIVSQAQAAEAMLNNENNTLHLDGTKKHFDEYGGFQISTNDGSYSLGHHLMASGDTESFVDATEETLHEMACAVTNDIKEQEDIFVNLMMSISNLMTDRHCVNKCYQIQLEKMRMRLCEMAGGRWSTMTEKQKEAFTKLNGVYCGLHLLPNMASSAVNGMKTFETLHGVHRKSGYNTSNPVAYDLCFQVSKSFVKNTGDQKSGDAAEFGDYLAEIGEKCHIVTFRHNRFNILFHDGGAVYYHRNHILEYLSSGRSSKNNRLLTAVKENITLPHVMAECRALGIIGKVVCGPLWRLLEDETLAFFDMNIHWLKLKDSIEQFCEDPKPLMNGKSIFENCNSFVKEDKVYFDLFEEHLEYDNLTLGALKEICKAMLPVITRQLKDQLPGGKYWEPDQDLLMKTKSVPLTNRISEADFSDLDRITRNAPQKGRASKSGLICFRKNKTSNFLTNLRPERREHYIKLARENAHKRISKDRTRTLSIRENKQKNQRKRLEEKLRKQSVQKAKLKILEETMQQNGVWVTEQEVCKHVSGLTKAKQMRLLKNQIQIHVHVLKSKLADKYLGKFQKGRKQFSVAELTENLVTIINDNFVNSVPEFISKINASVKQIVLPSKVKHVKSKQLCGKRKKQTKGHGTISKQPRLNFEVGCMYAIAFTDRWYPGRVLKVIDSDNAEIKFMKPCGVSFQWPCKNDISHANIRSILDVVHIEPAGGGRRWTVGNSANIDRLYKNQM